MSPPARLASISVDLDSLPHYCRIHGLPEDLLGPRAKALVHEVAIPRFLQLFEALGIRGTFFAIGEDLSDPNAARAIADAHGAGVEIASHTHSHDYAISRWTEEAIGEDLARAEQAIAAATGAPPVGFRAPGYTLSPALYRAAQARGYRYGSSAFPAAPYYLAKAAVMGLLAVRGTPSRSVLDTPRVLFSPREPYHPDPARPYSRGGGTLVELPMTVAPFTRFPFIGTFATTLPRAAVRSLYRSCRAGTSFFNFELHAIDVLDAQDGVPEALIARQRDLRVPKAEKLARLGEIFGWLREDYQVVTLAAAAAHFAR